MAVQHLCDEMPLVSVRMFSRLRPTLRQVFGLSLIGLLLGLALLFYLVLNGSERTILQSADRYRDLASREVAARVIDYLHEAPMAIDHFEQQVRYDLIQPRNPDSVEEELLSLLLSNENISEATLTYSDEPRSGLMANRTGAGQVALMRSPDDAEFICKRTRFDRGRFVAQSSTWGLTTRAHNSSEAPAPAIDPTLHLTFETPVSPDWYGQTVWSDLHWAQIDEGKPEAERRVEVSVQKTIEDSQGSFVGVLRIGLVKSLIDRAVQQHLTEGDAPDPHVIFLCDNDGRLITGFGDKDKVMLSNDDLRIPPADVPPVVARVMREPSLRGIDSGSHPSAAASFRFDNKDYLYTFQALPETQEWIVGVVVPRDYYLGRLLMIRRQVLEISVLLMAAMFLAGGLVVRNVMRSQALILAETAQMNRFEFAPAHRTPWLRDIEEVLASLEKAKTAMRAMSKYVPVNLVRKLYRDGEEAELGGKAAEVTVLFTDIKGFTSFSERCSPDRLAEVLGLYLQTVTAAIQSENGIIDKYIGDSVMALWNVPEETADHEILACRATLKCREALQGLYTSSEWGDAPHFDTRFGLHSCVASVGHFGAPDRFSYTAMGDGVNLASRLEGLNKYYETTIVTSEAIYQKASDHFEFRLLDCVAVMGKTQGITIYELISEKIPDNPSPEFVAKYRQAFAFYQRGDFDAAIGILGEPGTDGPARTLARRCREFLISPPKQWNGVWVFETE